MNVAIVQGALKDPLTREAERILRENDRGGFTLPTKGLYPHQWNWDSAFSALGWAQIDPDRAILELQTLFAAQWPDGMVPHIVFRADEPSYFPGPSIWQADYGPIPSSGISQPPIAASVARVLFDRRPDAVDALFDKMTAWHEWWYRARDPEDLGIIAIVHPWESGRDNLPDWDAPGEAIDVSSVGAYERKDITHVDNAMRPIKSDYDRYMALIRFGAERSWDQPRIARETPFLVADFGITAILLRAERDLMAIAERLNRPTGRIENRIERMERGIEWLWNPDASAYCSRNIRSGEFAQQSNAATFLAFYAGVETHKDALLALLSRYCANGILAVPSFDPDSPLFDPLRYWRGPVWIPINYLIADGLQGIGETEWANRIGQDSARLIRRSGFAEYFSPVDGRGCGGMSFSWTAALWLAWKLDELGDV
jgi:glycogen debranching enzyme